MSPESQPEGTTHTTAVTTRIRLRYLTAGTAIGAIWSLHTGSLWTHALRLAIVVLIAPPLIHLARKRHTTNGAKKPAEQLSILRLAAAKIALLGAAILGTWLLARTTPHAELIIGIAMLLIVASLGPILHPYLLQPTASAPHNERTPVRQP
ncbi:hypothetical protein [Catenulispora rubra]|uniref:hypothetical protein n=1 Tax=Catenulispora rubra TaxID=280293 RepID=UPI00189240F5|nr:hypothetical protein [Catenulispora rubra]